MTQNVGQQKTHTRLVIKLGITVVAMFGYGWVL